MPQVTVYIREEDINAWRSVEKKSEFIHNALSGKPTWEKTVELPKEFWGSSTLVVGSTPARACCLQRSPCTHWKWDGLAETYTNVLTGEVRGADMV
jgi:hypothetical protein